MGVSKSGYYQWIKRSDCVNRYEQKRILLNEMIRSEHQKHPSYGYHRLAARIRTKMDLVFSDHLIHLCCKHLRVASKARKYASASAGTEHVRFQNIVANNWNADKPMQIVASDMTTIHHRGMNYEWVYVLDTYNNEIIAHSLSDKQVSSRPYYQCLEALKRKTKEQISPVILHTDQGSVYSSQAFTQAHHDYNILRSMSRVATPTDNPKIEALNGWIKEELRIDFHLAQSNDIRALLNEYVKYFNHERPSFALNYQSPVQFRTVRGFG